MKSFRNYRIKFNIPTIFFNLSKIYLETTFEKKKTFRFVTKSETKKKISLGIS